MSWALRLPGTEGSDNRFTITTLGTGVAEMELRTNGNLIITGN